jgi:hypothetical protein
MKYFFGYPRRQWRYAAAMLALAGMMGFFAFFALMGAWYEEEWPWKLLKGAVGLGAAWGMWSLATGIFTGSIVPYFDRRVGVTGTFAQGQVVARNCRRLDRLAVDSGVSPVSAFGYADDLRGDTLAWHDPRSGLETVSALIKALDPGGADGKLVEELSNIRDALQIAVEKGAKFCFILRSGDGTNAQEHMLRKGTFF